MIPSIVVFLLVLLIMYWWADAGAFSSLLHLICVVVAGALAFALWEPLAYLLLPVGFSGFAFGASLLGVFVVTLVVSRLAVDRLVPANISLPRAADVVVGGAFGLASGVLTMGILLIGAGFMQSSVDIAGASGWTRRSDVPKAPTIGSDNAYLLHLVNATGSFYGYLSAGAFTPWLGGGTLGTHQPELTRTSWSLFRDSYNEGLARVSLDPASVKDIQLFDLEAIQLDPGVGSQPVPAYAVRFTVDQSAYDGAGQQFILSASQARVVGEGRNGKATVAHPLAWMQQTDRGDGTFYFNSDTSYATTIPGQGEGTFTLLFAKSDLDQQRPKFVQLKGVRFRLPDQARPGDELASSGSSGKLIEDAEATDLDAKVDFPEANYSLSKTLNSNNKGGLSLDEGNFIIGGEQRFPAGESSSVGSDLRIRGFKAAENTKVLRLDATATSGGARMFPDLNSWIREGGVEAQDGRIAVVDEAGNKYFAIGFAEDDGEWFTVHSAGGKPMTLRDIPIQTLGSGKKLLLYFCVPEGTQLKGLGLDTRSGLRLLNTISKKVPVSNV